MFNHRRQQDQDNSTLDDGPGGADEEVARSIWSMGGLDAGTMRPDLSAQDDPVQRFKERLKHAAREHAANPSAINDDRTQ